MALPLPRVVADVGPGGGLVTAMGGMNSLANDMLLRQMNQIKKQYLPTTMQAEASSKLAYANLMGPQFLAKLLGNDAAVANMGDPAARAALEKAVGAGMGQGSGANIFNQMQQGGHPTGIGQPGTNSLSGWFADKLKSAFGNSPKQTSNPFAQSNSLPGQYDDTAEASSAPQPLNNTPSRRPKDGVSVEGEQWYNRKGEPVYDEEVSTPDESMNLELTKRQKPKSYAENTGQYKGIVEEGKELGKIRATSKKELDQDYQQALQLKQPFQKLNSIITNPVFQKLRQLPGFQNLQMNLKANIGNEEEQKLIGEFQAAAQNVVASTVKGFGGRILASEIPLAESMKLNKNDTIGVMLGKAPVIEAFNEMTLQRSKLASKLIKEYHMDKGEALENADAMLDGDDIRKQVEKQLSPGPTEEDYRHMMQKYGISKEEVKNRLKSRGHI